MLPMRTKVGQETCSCVAQSHSWDASTTLGSSWRQSVSVRKASVRGQGGRCKQLKKCSRREHEPTTNSQCRPAWHWDCQRTCSQKQLISIRKLGAPHATTHWLIQGPYLTGSNFVFVCIWDPLCPVAATAHAPLAYSMSTCTSCYNQEWVVPWLLIRYACRALRLFLFEAVQ
jgi:hypothetical protein